MNRTVVNIRIRRGREALCVWLRATGKRCMTGSLLLSDRTGQVVLSFLNGFDADVSLS